MKYRIYSVFFVLLFLNSCEFDKPETLSTNEKDIQKLIAFSQLYGYVKYFHPSDEVTDLDWDAFAIYGTQRILDFEGECFPELLEELFKPIAPSLKFGKKDQLVKYEYFKEVVKNYSITDYDTLIWKHIGNGNFSDEGTYRSTRVSLDNHLGNFFSGFSIQLKVDKKTYAGLPIAVISNDNRTYPFTNKSDLQLLNDSLVSVKNRITNEVNTHSYSIGSLINVWNSVRFFYPYFEEKESLQFEDKFREIIKLILSDEVFSARESIQILLSTLNDAHVNVRNLMEIDFYPSVRLEFVDNRLIIADFREDLRSFAGVAIIEINGEETKAAIKNQLRLVSYGVLDKGKQLALNNVLASGFGETTTLKLKLSEEKDTILNLTNNITFRQYLNRSYETRFEKNILKINKNIGYLNLINLRNNEFENNIELLKKLKSIVIDLRGYPVYEGEQIENFLSHFLSINDTLNWLLTPIIINPNLKISTKYERSKWDIQPKGTFKNKNIYILINYKAISYAESILGYFEHIDNVQLVGSPSAGTNGNVNGFRLLGGLEYRYTGMKVLKHNGSNLHGIGFLSDVEVRPTIQGIIEGRDEVLEKAIELAKRR